MIYDSKIQEFNLFLKYNAMYEKYIRNYYGCKNKIYN